jgi:precorrin-6B methylase 2
VTWYTFINEIIYLLTEKPRGIDFSRSDFSFTSEGSPENYYSRTDRSTLKQLSNCLQITSADAFLDIGCGKGVVLCHFANCEFGRVLGIERFGGLAQIAENNIQKLRLEERIEILCCDALDFSHYEEFTHFFMFNPSKMDVAAQILQKIKDSINQKPRIVRIISVQPFYNALLQKSGFRLEQQITSKRTNVGTFIYRFN